MKQSKDQAEKKFEGKPPRGRQVDLGFGYWVVQVESYLRDCTVRVFNVSLFCKINIFIDTQAGICGFRLVG